MDKQSYKRLLADEMSTINELRNKIEDLKKKNGNLTLDSFSLKTIKRMVKEHSNDMELGGKIRQVIWSIEKNNKSKQNEEWETIDIDGIMALKNKKTGEFYNYITGVKLS